LPAIDEAGAALWPEAYPIAALERLKANTLPRYWSGLFQQNPQPDEGTYFQRDWLKSWEAAPINRNIYGSSDYAVTDSGGDYTVHTIWAVDPKGDLYRLDQWRGQSSADVWIDRKIDLIAKWKPLAWFGEAGVIQKAIEPMLRRQMIDRKTFCRLEWVPSIADKPTRARGFQARAAMGKVFFEPGADVSEFLAFPAGKHDDQVDTASLIGRVLDETHPAVVPVVTINPNTADYRGPRQRDNAGFFG
ncbi:phage terminase large subunit, partial [Flavobacterium sp.]|uniref:phage terminase large subunit n=1 Tax=Flavobacterium sp. TaxID=239 RepID=UPI003266E97E